MTCDAALLASWSRDRDEGSFNCFDFSIVVASWGFIGSEGGNGVTVIRLCRLARLLTLFKTINQLKVILVGIVQGLKSSIYIMMLIALVLYMSVLPLSPSLAPPPLGQTCSTLFNSH